MAGDALLSVRLNPPPLGMSWRRMYANATAEMRHHIKNVEGGHGACDQRDGHIVAAEAPATFEGPRSSCELPILEVN